MTGEEMERAIGFLLQSQASFETRLEQTTQHLNELTAQVTETGRQLQAYAQTQTQFIEICTRTMTGLAEAQGRTDATVERLASQVSVIAESQQHTDERLNALIDIVRDGRENA